MNGSIDDAMYNLMNSAALWMEFCCHDSTVPSSQDQFGLIVAFESRPSFHMEILIQLGLRWFHTSQRFFFSGQLIFKSFLQQQLFASNFFFLMIPFFSGDKK